MEELSGYDEDAAESRLSASRTIFEAPTARKNARPRWSCTSASCGARCSELSRGFEPGDGLVVRRHERPRVGGLEDAALEQQERRRARDASSHLVCAPRATPPRAGSDDLARCSSRRRCAPDAGSPARADRTWSTRRRASTSSPMTSEAHAASRSPGMADCASGVFSVNASASSRHARAGPTGLAPPSMYALRLRMLSSE